MNPATGGTWAWWRNGDHFVVGWMRPLDDDVPVVTVPDIRDAGLLVDTLTNREAKPIGG